MRRLTLDQPWKHNSLRFLIFSATKCFTEITFFSSSFSIFSFPPPPPPISSSRRSTATLFGTRSTRPVRPVWLLALWWSSSSKWRRPNWRLVLTWLSISLLRIGHLLMVFVSNSDYFLLSIGIKSLAQDQSRVTQSNRQQSSCRYFTLEVVRCPLILIYFFFFVAKWSKNY